MLKEITSPEPKLSPQEEAYRKAAQEARQLKYSPEVMSPSQRKKVILELIETLQQPNSLRDPDIRNQFVDKCHHLAVSDPLTDQQAGVVARYFQYMLVGELPFEYKNLKFTPLTADELVEVVSGDWEAIQRIFSLGDRAKAFKLFERDVKVGQKKLTVHRSMTLTPSEIKMCRKYGLIPSGLQRFGTLEKCMDDWFFALDIWQQAAADYPAAMVWQFLVEYPLSKAALLLETITDEGPSNRRLGISTTYDISNTKASIHFGEIFFKLSIPAEQLIRGTIGIEAEDTVLFFVPPEYIEDVYDLSSFKYSTELAPRAMKQVGAMPAETPTQVPFLTRMRKKLSGFKRN